MPHEIAAVDSSTAKAIGKDPRLALLPTFLGMKEIGELFHLQRTATHALVNRPDFPRSRRVGGSRHRLWDTAEVLAWFDQLPYETRRSMPAALAAARRYRNGKLVS